MTNVIIKSEGLKKNFGKLEVLKGIDVSIKKGEVVSIIGPSGGGKSTFLGTAVEFMHTPYFGTHGHIGFKVNSCERAKAFFESQGLAVNEDSISFDSKGNIKFFYLMDEIGGFALHVIKK